MVWFRARAETKVTIRKAESMIFSLSAVSAPGEDKSNRTIITMDKVEKKDG
jgi:hypothetical protein